MIFLWMVEDMVKMPDTLAEGRKAVRREDAVRELHELLQRL